MMCELSLSAIASEFTSGSDARAENAARMLAALGSQNLAVYNHLLSDVRIDVRWWAVRSLAEIQSPHASNLLLRSLQDPDVAVRQCAALALQRQPDPAASPQLIELLDSSDQLLSRLAADALISAGSSAVPALIEVMQGSNPKARIEAARALALIGDTRSIPVLFNALDEESAILEHWAGEGLERMGVGMVFFSP
jgi:HEAT repeat protein